MMKQMKQKSFKSWPCPGLLTACLAVVMLAGAGVLTAHAEVKLPTYKMTTETPGQIATPDKVSTPIGTLEFFDGVPTGNTTEAIYEYMDRARAVQVYVNMIPTVSMYSLRKAQHEMGAIDSHQILIWEDLMDSKTRWLTPNNTALYTLGFFDLKKDGPTVMELPPDVLGMLDDGNMRWLGDIGMAGPDKGKGGKYLLLPPGYEGEVPDGYHVYRSKTYTVWNFMRGYVRTSVKDAAENIKTNLKVYPLSKINNPPEMEFKNMSGVEGYNTIPPNDFSFYEMVDTAVQYEPVGFIDAETTGLMASIGIVKGQPFNPTQRMRRILSEAVALGNAYARANTVFPRDPGARIYKDVETEWVMGYADKDTYFLKDGARRYDSRLWLHYNAICVTPSMAVTKPGIGSDYGIAGLDANHDILYGSKTYKLHLPKNIPVKDNWSVIIYDTQTRAMLQTDQQFAGINSYGEGPKKNKDGSIDIYFAPEAPKGWEKNWIQTIPGKSWFIILRLYGPLEPWLDQTWRPSELELVK
ncbi:MAG: DUF1254 domain-containing protein [Desulfobacterales bacterium]